MTRTLWPAVMAGAVLLLGACGGVVVGDPGSAEPSVESVDQDAEPSAESSTEPSAEPSDESTEESTETDEDPRPMAVGDCLEKIGMDELDKPIPEYVDCAEEHTFEVTALATYNNRAAPFDQELLHAEAKNTCRGAYEAYTGRSTRQVGNAFGWDQPSRKAWDAGDFDYTCYATAPNFGKLVGSIALGR